MTKLELLSSTVLRGGYCIGCGACTALADSPLRIKLNEFGQMTAELSSDASEANALDVPVTEVCPFSGDATDEATLAQQIFPEAPHQDDRIGRYIACYVGHAGAADFRTRGSSGGVGKWLLSQLLRSGMVDAVVQVEAADAGRNGGILYHYAVLTSADDVARGAKSAYYPVEMSRVLQYIREHPGRYAITGVPCFIKALRLLAAQDALFRERITICVGIICGHLKSSRYADALAWQVGVLPGELGAIDFRKKIPGTRANQKGIEVWRDGDTAPAGEVTPIQRFFGGPYNLGFFQYRACDFCDDVVAETADVSVGDAWLPRYVQDYRGTSVVIVRNREIQAILEAGRASGELAIEVIAADLVAESQAGGLRQRREGLAYRLHLSEKRGEWHPPKRVPASQSHITAQRRKIYQMRTVLAEASHGAFQEAAAMHDFGVFERIMKPHLERYNTLGKGTIADRLGRLLRRIGSSFLQQAGIRRKKTRSE